MSTTQALAGFGGLNKNCYPCRSLPHVSEQNTLVMGSVICTVISSRLQQLDGPLTGEAGVEPSQVGGLCSSDWHAVAFLALCAGTEKKSRCDGLQPCRQCILRGTQDACSYVSKRALKRLEKEKAKSKTETKPARKRKRAGQEGEGAGEGEAVVDGKKAKAARGSKAKGKKEAAPSASSSPTSRKGQKTPSIASAASSRSEEEEAGAEVEEEEEEGEEEEWEDEDEQEEQEDEGVAALAALARGAGWKAKSSGNGPAPSSLTSCGPSASCALRWFCWRRSVARHFGTRR